MSKTSGLKKEPPRATSIRRGLSVLFAVTLAACTAVALAPAPQEDELHIELSTAGFTQAEVTHPAGAFAIAVDNLDVTEEYVLQLKGEGGALLNEIRVQKGSAVWAVELVAGRYTLMVANHPDWVCQIVIQ
ncbi:MAG TPA: hypothetical protein VD861_03220 [Pyrinomonadaceae bacterium]|nr:hypothetical protein [Pyrinomonadaceae bacterium]